MTEETMKALDKLWGKVDGESYGDTSNPAYKEYNRAIADVLGLIEDAGGMNPVLRAQDNGQFGVGA